MQTIRTAALLVALALLVLLALPHAARAASPGPDPQSVAQTPTENPADTATDAPAEDATDAPAENSVDTPADASADAPADDPVETPAFTAPDWPPSPPMEVEIVTVRTASGLRFDGKLRLPQGAEHVDRLVIFINGSGPNTYDNRRDFGGIQVNYFDLFADAFVQRDVAFFSYNTRGVTPGETPPLFADIDERAYQTYQPSNEVDDIARIIHTLQEDARLMDAKIYLLGWSAGTIIAPQVALAGDAQVDALLLAGYTNDTMAETLQWQQTGGSSMVFYNQYFDYDGDGAISPLEFDEDRYDIAPLLGVTFGALDVNTDGTLTREDFEQMLSESREAVFAAFEGGDDAWLRDNYGVHLTSAWYLDYANFPPNREVLPQLDLPIYIFHGRHDANTSVEGAEAIAEIFRAASKDNLTVHIFDADHDLNYTEYILDGVIPKGFAAIFNTVAPLKH